jgi:hypothetical protein
LLCTVAIQQTIRIKEESTKNPPTSACTGLRLAHGLADAWASMPTR